jgi:hypothetical protein
MSLGPDYGVMQINGMFKFGPGLAKEKINFMDKTQAIYRDGNIAVFNESVKMLGSVKKISNCLGCCCPCIPMGINHSIVAKRINNQAKQQLANKK